MYDLIKTKSELIEQIMKKHDAELNDKEYYKLKRFNEVIKNYQSYGEDLFKIKTVDAFYAGTKTKIQRFRESIKELR